MTGKTLYDKIWDAHLVEDTPGEAAILYIDRHLVHEVTSPQAFEGLRMAGRKVRRPDLAHLNIDVTIEDPGTFTKSVQRHMTWELAPGEDLSDYICTENNKYRENTDHK